MPELAGKEVVIKISGAATSMTGEATTNIDNQTYQVTNVVKQVFDRETPPTILVGGSATAEVYTVNYLNGKVTFATVNAGRGVVTITGKYLPMATAAYANSMSKSRDVDILPVDVFGLTHKKRLAGLKSASGTLSQFNIADTTYKDALLVGKPIVIEDRESSAGEPNRFWALLDNDSVESAVEGVQNETISWVSYDAWIRLGV